MGTKKETWFFPIFAYPGRDRIFGIRASFLDWFYFQSGFDYQIFCLEMIFVIVALIFVINVRELSYVKIAYLKLIKLWLLRLVLI